MLAICISNVEGNQNRTGTHLRKMPRNMRIFEVSSGGFSWACVLVVTDDSEVVVDGVVEAADESSMESDEVDAMPGGKERSRMARAAETGLGREMAMLRSVQVVLSMRNLGRIGNVTFAWMRVSRGEAIRGADSGSQVPHQNGVCSTVLEHEPPTRQISKRRDGDGS